MARMITFLPPVPMAIIPPKRALSPFKTRRRVEMFPRLLGGMAGGVAVGVAVGVGVGGIGAAVCTSKAPMSAPVPLDALAIAGSSKVRGKPLPRWSVESAPVRPLLVPLSIAGLPKSSAIVKVGPPLSLRNGFGPSISSFGSIGAAFVPTMSLLAFGLPAGKL